jgi:hypothetical protein
MESTIRTKIAAENSEINSVISDKNNSRLVGKSPSKNFNIN